MIITTAFNNFLITKFFSSFKIFQTWSSSLTGPVFFFFWLEQQKERKKQGGQPCPISRPVLFHNRVVPTYPGTVLSAASMKPFPKSFKGQKKSLRAFDAVSQNRHRRNSKKWEFTILVDFIVFLFSFWHKKSFHKINATLSLMVHTYPWPLTSLLLSIWKGFTVRTDKNVSFKFYLSHKILRSLLTRLDKVVH